MELIFRSTSFQEFFQDTIKQIHGEFREECLETVLFSETQSFRYEFNTKELSGYFNSFGIDGTEDIGTTIWEMEFKEDFTLIREALPEEEKILLTFIKSSNFSVEYLNGENSINQNFDLTNGMLTAASVTTSDLYFRATFPKGSKLKMVNTIIKSEKLKAFLDPERSWWIPAALAKKFKAQFQLSQEVSALLDEVFLLDNTLNSYLLKIKSFTYYLLAQVDDHLSGINMADFASVNYRDIVAIGNAEKLLIAQIDKGNTPKMSEIAKAVGMSISKFNGLFRKVYHDSPYEYYQKYRLNFAKQMIQSNKMSVSEAGRSVGYRNLSHFSEAFKKQFGVLPSQV